jgi:16S rRNA (guanine527-N7)-methyltransferase
VKAGASSPAFFFVDVSRETWKIGSMSVEKEPAAALSVFGDRIDLARSYADALARDSDTLGLLGPRELEILWSRHILNSAVVAQLVPAGKTVADVGSGAGLPGIPMAIAQPNAQFTLIEPMERRSDWLRSQVEELGLDNVEVLRARAEEVGSVYDIVTARAVSNLSKLLRLTVDLIRDGGELLALKGSRAADEIEEAKKLAKKLKISSFELLTVGSEHLAEPTTVVRTRLI